MREWLVNMRKAAELGQRDVSDAVGITQAAYSKIETGKATPSVPLAKKIAAALGFDWTRFYDEAGEGQESE